MILVDFYASLSQFFLLPGPESTFPEADSNPTGSGSLVVALYPL